MSRDRKRGRRTHPAEVGMALVLFLAAALGLPAADARTDATQQHQETTR